MHRRPKINMEKTVLTTVEEQENAIYIKNVKTRFDPGRDNGKVIAFSKYTHCHYVRRYLLSPRSFLFVYA